MAVSLSTDKYFSDRLIFTLDSFFKVANRVYFNVLHFFYLAPTSYTQLNKKTIQLFKHYLIERVGNERLERVSTRMRVDLDKLEKKGKLLRSRVVVKLLDAFSDVNASDIQEFIEKVKNGEIKSTLLKRGDIRKIKRVKRFDQLDKITAANVIGYLSNPLKDRFDYFPQTPDFITKLLSIFLFDFPLLLREKVFLCSSNHLLSKEDFYERLCKRIVRLEMNIGSIIPAYKDKKGNAQYYRVAAKLVTGNACISYTLLPLTKDMKELESIRVFKGSGMEFSSLDFISYLKTDAEFFLGKSAYESGKPYDRFLKKLANVKTEMAHSVGGTIIGYRAANDYKPDDRNDVKNVYLYNSPGVPKYAIKRFNSRFKESRFNIFIRRIQGDVVDYTGQYHIGYRSPNSVKVNFLKYILPNWDEIPHNTIFSKRRIYAITGGDLDYELNNFNRSYWEFVRWVIGGLIVYPICQIIKHINRYNFRSRAQKESGLLIEDVDSKKYQIKQIKLGRTFTEKIIS